MGRVIDSTLREGNQAVGVHFGLVQKKEIVASLLEVGIEEVEVGVATSLDQELPLLLSACRRLKGNRPVRISLWSRCHEPDIKAAVALGPDLLSLSLPVSDLQIEKKLRRSRGWVLEQLDKSVGLAKQLGAAAVSLGLEDASRAAPEFLAQVACVARSCGVERLRLADTVGLWSPATLVDCLRGIGRVWPGELAVHCHNDFGMATANVVAAFAAGATWADVTVLGLGERAGNARLEEVVGYLALVGQQKRYRTEKLPALCRLVARHAGRRIDPHHPLVGEAIFHCESGLHLHGLQREPATYEPYPPEMVGGRRQLFFGAKSGRRALAMRLEKMGVAMCGAALEMLLARVRERAVQLGRPLGDQELAILAGREVPSV